MQFAMMRAAKGFGVGIDNHKCVGLGHLRGVARFRGRRETCSTGVESRSAGNQTSPPGQIGRGAVNDWREAGRRASFPTHSASPCGPNRHPAPGQVQAWPNRNRPRSLRGWWAASFDLFRLQAATRSSEPRRISQKNLSWFPSEQEAVSARLAQSEGLVFL